ncbi:hypothetical protein M1188_15495 [Salmonella enterica subsp. enterica serovar Gaminara]|nr:hypothetical protein [Salmonella enterica]MCT7156808.1 hypothetical protein [Salmonella enterica subsp. enterica serovar Gaminara]
MGTEVLYRLQDNNRASGVDARYLNRVA